MNHALLPAAVLIVGGGLAAVRTAQGLRDLGHSETIRLVSAEREAPYDRPPLSKDFLLGRATDEAVVLLDDRGATGLGVDVRLGTAAVAVRPRRRTVELAGGGTLAYDALVLATGARARRLPIFDGLPGVHHLRDVGDARALRAALLRRAPVAVVGGGFVGLEVAAVARTLGCPVTVIEAAEQPLAPIVGTELGSAIRRWHERHGVAFRCGETVAAVRGAGRERWLELAGGATVPAAEIVVGVGAEPNTGWLAGSGLELHRGVACDAHGRTSLPGIYAVGDVACRHLDGRCEPGGHWTGTSEQALRVAEAVLGRPDERPLAADGYFWSDQYDSRLQFAGRVGEGASVTVTSGALDSAFVATCSSGGEITGVLARDDPRGFVRARIALRAGRTLAA